MANQWHLFDSILLNWFIKRYYELIEIILRGMCISNLQGKFQDCLNRDIEMLKSRKSPNLLNILEWKIDWKLMQFSLKYDSKIWYLNTEKFVLFESLVCIFIFKFRDLTVCVIMWSSLRSLVPSKKNLFLLIFCTHHIF